MRHLGRAEQGDVAAISDFRRVCKDMTFSGPKSSSIIEAFASDAERRELRRMFDEAINETLANDIEPDMQLTFRRLRVGCGGNFPRFSAAG